MKKKPIILYEAHRNVIDIIAANKKNYRFVNLKYFVKVSKIAGLVFFKKKDKTFSCILYFLLKLFQPKYIIACNWITPSQKIYYEYAKKNTCQFLVVQHGSYIGGIVTIKNHKYLKCNKFLVWGEYFRNQFIEYNKNRKEDIVVFGNPIYNKIDRNKFKYPVNNKNILFALSYYHQDIMSIYMVFLEKYQNVFIKFHNKQYHQYKRVTENVISGSFEENIMYFDLVIVEHSTALLDAVFFKKNVIFINRDNKETIYAQFLKNHFNTLKSGAFSLDELIDQPAQEKLFQYIITLKDNNLETVLN
jgi:hypothetical protein